MPITIRPYHPSDLYSLYRICLQTGASGDDASQMYRDAELLGHIYVAPYAVLEPDLCFVLTHDGAPCGYILGTRDSAEFADRCEREWFPVLRARYTLPPPDDQTPDAQMIRSIHKRRRTDQDLAAYPAHLHIDLLPIAQGQGWGRRLMSTFLERLRALDISGVHLGVGARNHRAIRFYERVGFVQLVAGAEGILYGMRLESAAEPSLDRAAPREV
jgi:ribosomal protein S18 acetylase RimI-like enzyme